jgi:hypothetical protein
MYSEPTGTKQTSYGHFADILKKSNHVFKKTRYLSLCARIFDHKSAISGTSDPGEA